MSQDIYILSLPCGTSSDMQMMYVGKHGPTIKLGDAKTFTSKYRIRLSRLFNDEYRWWNVICLSRKTVFKARLMGK